VLVTLQRSINGVGLKHCTTMRPRLDFLAVPIPIWLSACFALLVIFLVLTMYLIIRHNSQKSAYIFLVGSFLWCFFSEYFGHATEVFSSGCASFFVHCLDVYTNKREALGRRVVVATAYVDSYCAYRCGVAFVAVVCGKTNSPNDDF
jgi:hypothetical protein